MTPKYSNYTFFWRKESPFSQWHPSIFTINGRQYCTAEQWMMWSKAMLFGDEKIAEKIMATRDPSKHKMLGKEVKNFNEEIWAENRLKIVYLGNHKKFTANDNLLQALGNTKGTTLVEASPYDKIWGIGMLESNPDVLDFNKWKGQNLLGYVLTELRDDLMKINVIR